MKEFVRFQTEIGNGVVVEVEEPESQSGLVRAGRRPGQAVLESAQSIAEVTSAIQPVVHSVAESFRNLDFTPDEIELTFGLKLTFSAGAVIASTSAEGNIQIRLKWSGNAETE